MYEGKYDDHKDLRENTNDDLSSSQLNLNIEKSCYLIGQNRTELRTTGAYWELMALIFVGDSSLKGSGRSLVSQVRGQLLSS